MTFRLTLLAVLFASGLARAQEAEQLLPARTHLYFRWDGHKAHKDAFQRTALGKMMQGDTGKLIDNLYGLLRDNVQAALTVRGLLDGAPPEQVQKMQQAVAQAMKLPQLLGDNGFVLAAELQAVLPPAGQATFILPNCDGKPLFAAIELGFTTAGETVKAVKVEDRNVTTIELEPLTLTWWQEGKHAVVVLSSFKPEVVVSRMTSGRDGKLTDAALYRKLTAFKDFETSARGFFDLESLLKMGSLFSKDVKQALNVTGLDSLKAVTLQSGFENEAERGLLEIQYNGARKGLLAMTAGKPFKLADVPVLPHDVISWNMATFDAAATYDAVLKAAETLVGIYAPTEAAKLKELIQQADQTLGIDIRKDLLGALGDRIVQYSSPAEGAFTLSQTIAIKVKNGERLMETLDQASKGIAGLFSGRVALKKRKYQGVDMREIRVSEMGFFFLPSYAVVDGWLVLSYYPQPIQGFILRAQGDLPTWKPDDVILRSLDKLPKEFLSVSVSDPRPTVKQVLSLGPLVGSLVRSFLPDSKFDPALVPNAHEATRHLFPNVSVLVDDGKSTQLHTRASLALPFDIAGLDAIFIASFAASALFGG